MVYAVSIMCIVVSLKVTPQWVVKLQANWRVCGRSIPRWPRQTPGRWVDSKLAGMRNLLPWQFGWYSNWPRVDPGHMKRKPRLTKVSRPVKAACKPVAKSTQWIMLSAVQLGTFCLHWLRFLHDFSSVVRWISWCNVKRRHGSHSRSGIAASRKCVPKVTRLQHATLSLWVQTPESHPAKYPPPPPPPPPKKKWFFFRYLFFNATPLVSTPTRRF